MTATRSSALKTTGPTCQVTCQGNVTVALAIGVWPQMRGMSRLSTTRSWESPMVATVRMRRGRAPEAPHDQDLDGGGQEDGGDEPGGQPEEVVDAREGDQADGEDGRRRAEVALGEVDDLVQPVGEAEADRHERAEQAEHGALQPHPERHGEQDQLHDQHGGDREHRRHGRSTCAPATAVSPQRLMPFSWRRAASANLPPRVAHMPHLSCAHRVVVHAPPCPGAVPWGQHSATTARVAARPRAPASRPETVTGRWTRANGPGL